MRSLLTMKLYTFLLLNFSCLALAASSTSDSMSMSVSMSMSMTDSAAMTTSTDNSPPYSITALPAVASAPSCLFNCMNPIGLADASKCNNVTENCACLSAPADAIDFLTGCIETVCKTSTSEFAASATSFYDSYCNSVYGTATFSEAFVEESSAAAASSSIASVEATQSSSSSKSSSTSSASGSAAPTKSDGGRWEPALLFGALTMGGLLTLVLL